MEILINVFFLISAILIFILSTYAYVVKIIEMIAGDRKRYLLSNMIVYTLCYSCSLLIPVILYMTYRVLLRIIELF